MNKVNPDSRPAPRLASKPERPPRGISLPAEHRLIQTGSRPAFNDGLAYTVYRIAWNKYAILDEHGYAVIIPANAPTFSLRVHKNLTAFQQFLKRIIRETVEE